MDPAAVLASANQTVISVLKDLEGTQAEDDWNDAIEIIESQLVMVRNVLDPTQVVPLLLIATEKHWKWEEGDWPDMDAIIKCPEEDLIDHPWYRMGRTTVSPPDATLVKVTYVPIVPSAQTELPPKVPLVNTTPASIPQGKQAPSNPSAPPEKYSSQVPQEQNHPPSQDPGPAPAGPQTLRPTTPAPPLIPSPDAEGPTNIPARTGRRRGRPGTERTWRYCSVHEQVERACTRCIAEGVLCLPKEGKACQPCKARKKQCSQARIPTRSRARSPTRASAPGSSATDANRAVEPKESQVATGLQPMKFRRPSCVANKRKTPTDTNATDDECLAATGPPERTIRPPPSRAAAKRKRPAITEGTTDGLAKKPRLDASLPPLSTPLPEVVSSAALTAVSTSQQRTSQQAGPLDNGGLRTGRAYAVGGGPFISRDEFQRLERTVDQLRNRLALYARKWEGLCTLAYLLRVSVMSNDDDRGMNIDAEHPRDISYEWVREWASVSSPDAEEGWMDNAPTPLAALDPKVC